MPAESQDFALPQRFSGYGSDSNSAEAWGGRRARCRRLTRWGCSSAPQAFDGVHSDAAAAVVAARSILETAGCDRRNQLLSARTMQA